MINTLKFLVTGGAGFIVSTVIRELIANSNQQVLNLDKLTYAGNLESLTSIEDDADITMHLAAASHVDRSIDGPGEFIWD